MILRIQNKLVSIGGSSTVKDQNGKDVFIVKGKTKLFSPSKKKWIMDLNKKKLYLVRNKIFHQPFKRSCLIYDSNKVKVARIKEKYVVKVGYDVFGGEEKIELVSSGKNKFFAYPLDILVGGKKVGSVRIPFDSSKDVFRISDCFELEVIDEEDAALLVAFVIGIDNIRDADRKKR